MTAPPASVLIVDDDAFVRTSAAEIVRRAGYQVHEAADGATALSVLAEAGSTSSSSTSACRAREDGASWTP